MNYNKHGYQRKLHYNWGHFYKSRISDSLIQSKNSFKSPWTIDFSVGHDNKSIVFCTLVCENSPEKYSEDVGNQQV